MTELATHALDLRSVITVQAQALSQAIYSGVATSIATTSMRAKGLEHTKYPHVRPLLVRAFLREHLESEEAELPPGWDVAGNARQMGQLLLQHQDLELNLTFLKERRSSYPGGVPTAGSNTARRNKWLNPPLDIALPEPPIEGEADACQLLLLWDFAANDEGFTVRIVHPRGPGVYGEAVPCDLVLELKPHGQIYTRRRFEGSADEEDLFARVDREDNVGG
ncbi:hypothetical protein WDZ17_16820 [Pseudokineococcus basanitobsidens]|uniref:Uncharacterized protein n=1 Tax=Pseudokineococcus basanitobsidens TaxID=1926649 RepID=A0ABU8RPG9_9ACTN